jgi:quercetin dioxygenase-like cupin family protein/mannose-6-phosphate isomerase-like protein (cupin superfamily)
MVPVICVLGLLAPALASQAAPVESSKYTMTYADLHGEVVLDNERVLVQKFVIQPGQSTGARTNSVDQLLVFIKGGVLKSAAGRSILWTDGRVQWRSAADRPDAGAVNSDTTPIEIICVSFKPVVSPAKMPANGPKYRYLNYPNIPGQDLLENDQVIVQRFIVNPGQWEGVHAHHPDMLYIHIKGGQWAARSKSEPEHAYPTPSPDGEVGWMPTIDISEGHESRNIGKEPIDLVWVTLKH